MIKSLSLLNRNCRLCKSQYIQKLYASTYSAENDARIVRRNDFRGITSNNQSTKRMKEPDVVLSKIHENLKNNYRVSGETILFDVVRKLEDNSKVRVVLSRNSKWIPMLLSCCGHPMSNVEKSSRNQIFERLWTQLCLIQEKLPLEYWNIKFRVLNENEIPWDIKKERAEMEKHGVTPDRETFHHFIQRTALNGDSDGCKNIIYDMARFGYPIDEAINGSLIFCFSVRGHYLKVDSLVEQTIGKYGESAEKTAYGATACGAAYRSDHNRLRGVLRKALNPITKKLRMSTDDIFETIWQLAEKSHDGTGSECVHLVEQILNCTSRDFGFFRKQFREVERHITHGHYYTALAILEDTKRVSDCLQNQKRTTYLYQLLGRLASQLIRNKEPLHLVRDIANRVHFTFNHRNSNIRIRMYDDLLYSALMLKDIDIEEKLNYFKLFIDEIDPRRERIHITLPLLSAESDVNQRLAILFLLSNLGYNNWSDVNIDTLAKVILQPIYMSNCRPQKDMSRLDKFGRILKSYGITDKQLWMIMYQWSKKKELDESRTSEEGWVRPHSKDLKGWCKAYYYETFEHPKPSEKRPIYFSYSKLKAYVDQRDVEKVSSILFSNESGGWPSDTDYNEVIPLILNLFLNHESWQNVQKLLNQFSQLSVNWDGDPSKTPLKNYHLLMILRRLVEEEEELSIRKLTDFAYELRNLFPNATSYYEGFFETQTEYKKLFNKCFEKLEKNGLSSAKIDDLIEFLRSMVKIDLLQLHPSETLTVFFVNILLKRMGWNEALNSWKKFLSGLHCGNGTVALLRYCLQNNSSYSKKNIQYVLHRGATFLSQSRIAAMHVAVLIGMKKYDEAENCCDNYLSIIDPNDCVMAMKLMNSLKSRSVDEKFMLEYADICLRRLSLASKMEQAQIMQSDLLRICDIRQMGPAALRVYKMFSEYNVPLGDEEKTRLKTVIDKHSVLSKKWLFKPDGLLLMTDDDPIIAESEVSKIEYGLNL